MMERIRTNLRTEEPRATQRHAHVDTRSIKKRVEQFTRPAKLHANINCSPASDYLGMHIHYHVDLMLQVADELRQPREKSSRYWSATTIYRYTQLIETRVHSGNKWP